jgi:hypothetical protein
VSRVTPGWPRVMASPGAHQPAVGQSAHILPSMRFWARPLVRSEAQRLGQVSILRRIEPLDVPEAEMVETVHPDWPSALNAIEPPPPGNTLEFVVTSVLELDS